MSGKQIYKYRNYGSRIGRNTAIRESRGFWLRYLSFGLVITGILTMVPWTLPLDAEAADKVELRNAMGRCLDVAGGKNANGTNVQIYDCNRTKSQHWKSITIAAAKPAGGVAHWQLVSEKNAASETISIRKNGSASWRRSRAKSNRLHLVEHR